MAPKFNPMERITLSALLAGLQGGMNGGQAYDILSGVLQQQQARIQQRKQMLMEQMGFLSQTAGSAPDAAAGNAYLGGLISSGAVGPKMGQKLESFNESLYPGGGQSPLYGITGQAAADSGIPEAEPITGFTDSQLSRYFREPGSSGNAEIGVNISRLVAQGNSDPDEIYQSLRGLQNSTGYFALMEPAATRKAIMNILERNGLIPAPPPPWEPPVPGAGAAVPPQQNPYTGAGGNYGAAPAPPAASPYMGAGGPYGYRR